jgi:hypothetical protein
MGGDGPPPGVASLPTLYRVSRLLRRIGVVVAVVIVLYVALTIYSASQIRVGSGGGASATTVSANVVSVTSELNLSNGGPLPITGVELSSVVYYPDGSLVAVVHSPTVRIAPSASASVPLTIAVPLSSTGAAALLLTHSVTLSTRTSVNVTFGGIVTIEVEDHSGLDWGAPFDSLNATVGTPAPQSNGTTAVPVHITFSDRAQFPVEGELSYSVHAADTSVCGGGTVGVSVGPGAPFDQTPVVYLAAGCSIAGGSVVLAYSGGGLSVALPPEALP